jgi:hypothetical protein
MTRVAGDVSQLTLCYTLCWCYGVKRNGSQSNHPIAEITSPVRSRQHHDTPYQRVRDERKRPIRGLWIRNDRYYAQLTLEDENTGQKKVRRVPLEGAASPLPAQLAGIPRHVIMNAPVTRK